MDSAISSAVSAPMSMPAGARRAAIRSSPIVVSSRSHSRTTPARVGDATRPTYDASRVSDEPDGLLVPDPLARDDDVRRGLGIEAPDVGRGVDALGARERVGVGDRVDDRDPPAGGRARGATSAPAIGVVPTTHSSGAGRCGST